MDYWVKVTRKVDDNVTVNSFHLNCSDGIHTQILNVVQINH